VSEQSRSPATPPSVHLPPPADRDVARANQCACETRFCSNTGTDFSLDGEWMCDACLADSAIEQEAQADEFRDDDEVSSSERRR
jgi:hypothetical protein